MARVRGPSYNRLMKPRLPKPLTVAYAALAYERVQLEVRLALVREDMMSLASSIRLIDPNWKPKRAQKPVKTRGLGHGAISRNCLRHLRTSPGISTQDLSARVAAACGVELKTTPEREDFASAVAMCLRRYERRGILEVVGENARTGALRWRVKPIEQLRSRSALHTVESVKQTP
jgi:hypothetical protein